MADVKWIKIMTDIFYDEKILMIECIPSADSLIVIWFKLLCMAGKMNNDGVFIMNNKIAYTDEMLAAIFRRDVNTVRMALATFQQYGMIEIVDDVITIPNWNKHQTLDSYEKKKERDRIYQQERRKKQRELIGKSSDSKTIQSSDVVVSEVEQEVETEKEKDKRSSVVEEAKLPNHTHISTSVYQDLCNKYGKAFVDERVDRAYSDKALIRFCEEDYGKPSRKPKSSGFSNQRQYDFDELEKQLIGGKPKAEDDP